jgi:hypothetical protein
LRVAERGNRGCKFVLKGIVVFSGVEELGHRCTDREIQNLGNFVILQVFLWLTLRRRSATALYFAFLHRSPFERVSLRVLMTCCGRRRRVYCPVFRRKTSKPRPRSRGDKAAKRRLATPDSKRSPPLALVESERDPFEQDSAHCPLGKGAAGQSAPRMGSTRKRRRSLIADSPACDGGEPPCYQHLFEGL